MRAWLLALAACSHRAPIASCADDLHGVWIAPDGQRWMMLDNGPRGLEAYPLFDDAAPIGDVVVAPRVIDLARDTPGSVKRRYMRRADACEARAPAQLGTCAGDAIELVLGEVGPPEMFAPCSWPAQPPPHVERWQRD